MLGWSEEQKCYQLKLHLTKTALQVYELLPRETRTSYAELVTSLKDRFKPVDIEELRGLEFHQLMQKEESVEKLGLWLMSLARKAFPTLGDKELDRLLKGRFFQALLPKWQRKLGAPKVSETFSELYERARICERHGQQYRGVTSPQRARRQKQESDADKDSSESEQAVHQQGQQSYTPRSKRQSSIECFKVGHFRCNCPERVDKSEATGKSGAGAATVSATETSPLVSGDSVSSLSDADGSCW